MFSSVDPEAACIVYRIDHKAEKWKIKYTETTFRVYFRLISRQYRSYSFRASCARPAKQSECMLHVSASAGFIEKSELKIY